MEYGSVNDSLNNEIVGSRAWHKVVEDPEGEWVRYRDIHQMATKTAERKINPGQLWVDRKNLFSSQGDGDFVYLVCSQEPGMGPWVCMTFQDWEFGSYQRFFTQRELNTMEYAGHIKDLK